MSDIDNVLMENWTDTFLNSRMELPRVWVTLDNGFEIQELQSHRIDEVIEMIKVNNLNYLIDRCNYFNDIENILETEFKYTLNCVSTFFLTIICLVRIHQ